MVTGVALHAESVDRNYWLSPKHVAYNVALHAESVDRNLYVNSCNTIICKSLSMRRAWIEIPVHMIGLPDHTVALHAESVDRNYYDRFEACDWLCRSPCGERG